MTAEVLLYHLAELGVSVALGASSSELSIDAPRDTLTPELTELLREHKSELIALVYAREEAQAIEDEGKLSNIGREALNAQKQFITAADSLDASLVTRAKASPVLQHAARVFKGLEIVGIFENAEETRGLAA